MAITFRAAGVSPGASSDSCVIVKPVGLSVGDLMIAQVAGTSSGAQGAHTAPGGWASIRQDGTTQPVSSLFWKIADAADVAASDFTFTATGASVNRGAISAWYNTSLTAPINANNGQLNTGGAPTVTAPGITPTVADCVLLLLCSVSNDYTTLGYAIVTDNPGSWNERYDILINAAFDLALALGSAARPEVSATGEGTATVSGALGNTIGQLVAISPPVAAKRGWAQK